MRNRKVTFDFGAWLQTPLVSSMLPYTTEAFPAILIALIALEPDRWMLQVQPDGYIRFEHGVEEIMGTHLVSYEGHLILPALDTPIPDTTSLSNLDFSKCFVEVDVVEMSMSDKEQRHTLEVVSFQPQKYGQTCEHHPTYLGFRPSAAPTRHLNQLRVHLRNSGHAILQGPGGTLTVLSQRPGPPFVEHAIARRATRDARKQRAARAVSREQARPFSNSPAGDVVPGRNLGSGAVPAPVAAHLAQRVDPTGGYAPPLQLTKPGRARVSVGGHLRHGAGRGGRLAATPTRPRKTTSED